MNRQHKQHKHREKISIYNYSMEVHDANDFLFYLNFIGL